MVLPGSMDSVLLPPATASDGSECRPPSTMVLPASSKFTLDHLDCSMDAADSEAPASSSPTPTLSLPCLSPLSIGSQDKEAFKLALGSVPGAAAKALAADGGPPAPPPTPRDGINLGKRPSSAKTAGDGQSCA